MTKEAIVHRAGLPYAEDHHTTVPRGGECLPDLLWEQVWAQPDAVAVVSGDRRLTFRELAQRAAGMAVYLRGLGVASDARVGLFAHPSIDMTVAVWGILLAGGAYVPLSPDYPAERLRYMIDDSGIELIVAQDALSSMLAELTDVRAVTPAGAARFAARREPVEEWELRGAARPGGLAYVIYTSGSTGRPKGVMIEHRAIVNQMRWLNTVHRLDRDRVVLQKTPISFDAAQWEILATGCGSTVVMGEPGLYRDPERLIDTIIEHGVTTLQCVPTLLKALLETGRLTACGSLRQVFSGGEALSRPLARRCLDALPGANLTNLYGPTECAINASAHVVTRQDVADGPQTVPIGKPVHNTRFYILDEDLAPVSIDEVGELYVGGVQLARGYLNRPGLTAERFIDNPFPLDHGSPKLYRTGDLATWTADGTAEFVGRVDNQVKVRGFRVELDEVSRTIEAHDWVRNAAVIVRQDPRTAADQLVAFVELDSQEAALMDQDRHSAHHLSKASRLQVRAQLSNGGCREDAEVAGRPAVDLPGREPTAEQWRRVFARKTYRFYEGGRVTKDDLARLLARRTPAAPPRSPAALDLAELGAILRYFGQFHSGERLLPKYGYASPGALYATQLYLELAGIAGLDPGFYYYHPVHHRLVRIQPRPDAERPVLRLHFAGKRPAIEPVYHNNVGEVLEIETGHMVGMLEEILPGHGLDVRPSGHTPGVMAHLECGPGHDYLGTFEVVRYDPDRPGDHAVDFYVQAHPGGVGGLPAGLYRFAGGEFSFVSPEVVERRHVIAINQRVYRLAGFGISMVATRGPGWLGYIDLGRALQRLQMNDLNLGFMSSGYSSKTGHDLPSATRLSAILRGAGLRTGPSYFCVGGRVSDEQVRDTGMREDSVHMKGPRELIRDDLVALLPEYMVPGRVEILERLPLTPSGKIDTRALAALDLTTAADANRQVVPPRTPAERRVAEVWQRIMRVEEVSVHDDFFYIGGDSMVAMALVNTLNEKFGRALPLQVVFEAPTVEQLALRIGADRRAVSRLIPLQSAGGGPPVYMWPGLGGYPMNLRGLAGRAGLDRPVYGVQAHGINEGETPYASIAEMAAADIELIRAVQPAGPYTLVGYSFGARVAYEVAHRLERAGEKVADLLLVAPGSPRVTSRPPDGPGYRDPVFVTILWSVFAASVSGPMLEECLDAVHDEDGFVAFTARAFPALGADLIRRIVRIVHLTYNLTYTPADLAARPVAAPVTVLRARGDEPSFIECRSPVLVDLAADHYGTLTGPGLDELIQAVRDRLIH
ncbi:amino acid adenylation domain-containing protein [Spongiactinospora sp. 9N601]|uniref:amino acid adenylation domain-containing protein n=1 Tax=Spongiactinospora sp. 9N601 TaxID=3375149 RepID=UPI003792C163